MASCTGGGPSRQPRAAQSTACRWSWAPQAGGRTGTLRIAAAAAAPAGRSHPAVGAPRPAGFSHPAVGAQLQRRACPAAARAQAAEGLTNPPWEGTPAQERALAELQRRMASGRHAGPPPDLETLRWFLLDRKLDVAETQDKLNRMLQWRQEMGADTLTLTDVANELATGKAYVHTHLDLAGRPVVVVRAARHVIGGAPPLESQRLCAYVLDAALERLPEGQDTVLGIFDLRGFSPANADLAFARFMVDAFFYYYPKRVSRILFVEAPWMFRPAWEVVRPWLHKYAALVRFVTVDEVRQLFLPEACPPDFVHSVFLQSKRSAAR